MKSLIFLLISLMFISCGNAQESMPKQYFAICQQGNGCKISEIQISADEIDRILGKTNFWVNAPENAILVLEKCQFKIEENLSKTEIHQSFGGTENPKIISDFDIQNYLKQNSCIACPNPTKKISFHANAEGQSGNGYFYLSLQKAEAYMPNDAFQMLYAGQIGSNKMVIDQFIRNGQMETYSIAEGKKYKMQMALGTNISVIKDDTINEKRFKDDFEKTGKTRKHLQTNQLETEYIGKDDEGKAIHFWITPSYDVCLPTGKFDAFGFYNLGYISVDRLTYLVTEISGAEFQIKITGIADGTYQFNPTGYQSY